MKRLLCLIVTVSMFVFGMSDAYAYDDKDIGKVVTRNNMPVNVCVKHIDSKGVATWLLGVLYRSNNPEAVDAVEVTSLIGVEKSEEDYYNFSYSCNANDVNDGNLMKDPLAHVGTYIVKIPDVSGKKGPAVFTTGTLTEMEPWVVLDR